MKMYPYKITNQIITYLSTEEKLSFKPNANSFRKNTKKKC